MGVGPHALALYVELARAGILHKGQSVIEIGSQDVVADGFDMASLFAAFGAEPQDGDGSARSLMLALGFSSYGCLDMDGRHDAIRLDFNTSMVSRFGEFDVVTNLGTTEHVFDQARCFALIHNLTRPDGLMIHLLPSMGQRSFDDAGNSNVGYGDHGFYLYTPTFFKDLASANDYEILKLRDEVNKYGTTLVFVARRRNSAPFISPIQGIYR